MLKRKYRTIDWSNSRSLIMDLEDITLEFVCSFISIEIRQFAHYIIPDLERVLSGEKENSSFAGNLLEAEYDREMTAVYHQMDDRCLEPPSQLSTKDFYRLVKEYEYVKAQLKLGKLEFPFELEDGEWLVEGWKK